MLVSSMELERNLANHGMLPVESDCVKDVSEIIMFKLLQWQQTETDCVAAVHAA